MLLSMLRAGCSRYGWRYFAGEPGSFIDPFFDQDRYRNYVDGNSHVHCVHEL